MLTSTIIRLYPNKTQKEVIDRLLGSCRFVYNKCLSLKEDAYRKENKILWLNDLSKYYHGTLRAENDWLIGINTKIIKQSILNLNRAYKNYFKSGFGKPKLKLKKDKQSLRFPREVIPKITFNDQSTRISLSTSLLGVIFRCSKEYRQYICLNKEKIKSISITKRKCGHYYASLLIDGHIVKMRPEPKNKIIGVDLGIKNFITLSNGDVISNIKTLRKYEYKAKSLQRILSRKKIGSKNRDKARLKYAKLHERINNIRKNHINISVSKIIDDNQVIVLEDLNVCGMMRNHKLAKSIQDVGFSVFRSNIEYQARAHDRRVIVLDMWYPSSKTCSFCGNIKHDLSLSDRIYSCDICGGSIDRDLNAAINIQREGARIYNNEIDKRIIELTPVEISSSKGSGKQEGFVMQSVA